jgi:1-deoxy-D-xylulose-5-phosphate synthase
MGMRYLGPIDGHNLPLLISTLEFAKTCDHPIVIHVLTQKGKGLRSRAEISGKIPRPRALRRPDRRNARAKPGTAPMYQDVMGQTMVKLCQRDNRSSASPPPCPAAPA